MKITGITPKLFSWSRKTNVSKPITKLVLFSFLITVLVLGVTQKNVAANSSSPLDGMAFSTNLRAPNPPTDLVITLNGASDFYTDSNKFCGTVGVQGPDGMWLPVHITNNGTSGYTYTGLVATVTPPSNTVVDDPTRYIGNLGPGQSVDVFYYFDYRALRTLGTCANGTDGWYSSAYSVTITSLNNGLTAPKVFNDTFTTISMISANAGGLYMSDFLGPGVAVGQVFTQTITYGFGNNPANSALFLQPTGNGNFNDQCFRVVGSRITTSTVLGVAAGSTDTFYFPTTDTANGDTVQIELRWLAMCSPGSTSQVLPWAEITSGTQYKYNGAGYVATPNPLPIPLTNQISITKSVNPTWLPTGGSATYTITLTNAYTQPLYIDWIVDVLPAGFTFTGYDASSTITAANSTISPSAGASGTLTWYGIPSPLASRTYQIPASSSITLKYTVNVPNTDGVFTNSATGGVGSSIIGPATSSVTVGKLTPSVTTTIHDASHNAITSIAANSTVHDSATVSGTGTTPTGTVNFNWFTTINCTGAPVAAGTNIALAAGVAHPSTSEGPLSAGSYSFQAHYNGDSNYKTADSACEPLNVLSAPSIAKAFGAATVALNGTTTLTFTITNPNAGTALTGVAFTDSLPAGLTVASGSSAQCGGTLTTTSPSTISLAGGSIAAAGNCVIPVTVTGATAGVKNNTTGNVTSTNGGTGNTANANITVVAPPSIAKAFGAATIPQNGTTTLTFTITNPNAGTALTGVAFTDSLPAGLTVASGSSAQCGGTLTTTSPSTISLAGGSIAAAGNCSFGVTITGATAGVKNNTTGNVTSTNGGTGNTASDTTTVVAPPSIAKAFADASILQGATSTLTFTITNPNVATALAGVAFADSLPSGLTVASATTGQCGGTLTLTAPDSIALTGASVAALDTCTFNVTVTGDAAGIKVNTTGNVTSTNGGTGNTATASITVTPPTLPATGSKVFFPDTIKAGENSDLGIWIYAPIDTTLTSVSLTDTLPAGIVISNSSPATVICTGASVIGSLTVNIGSNVISWSNGIIFAGELCRIDVFVTGDTVGLYPNVISGLTDFSNDQGRPLSTDLTANLTVSQATPSISTTLSSTSVDVGGMINDSSTLTGASPTAGGTVTYAVYTNNLCTLGAIPAGVASVTNGVVADSDSIQFNTVGTYYWQAVYSGDGNNFVATSTCTEEILTVNPLSPSISTFLSAPSIVVGNSAYDTAFLADATSDAGGAVTYNIYSDNACISSIGTAGTKSVTNGIVTDSDPFIFNTAGDYYWQAVYSGDTNNNGTTSTCTDEHLVVTPTSPTVTTLLSAANINVGGSAYDSATILGATADAGGSIVYNVYTDSACTNLYQATASKPVVNGIAPDSDAVTFTAAGTYYWKALYSGDYVNNGSAESNCGDEVLVVDRVSSSITTLLSASQIPVGTTASDSATLSGVTSDAGGFVSYNIYSDSSCTFAIASGGTKTVINGVVPDSNSVTFNTAGIFYWQAVYSGDSNNVGSSSGCTEEQITVIAPTSIDKFFTPGTIIVGDTSVLTFTITNPNASTDLTGVAFNDFLPAGVFVPDGGPIAQCGGLLETISPDWIRLSGATIAAGGTCNFDVTVTGVSTGTKINTSQNVTSVEGGTGNTATANLTVDLASPTITTNASPSTGTVGTSGTFGDSATITSGYGLLGQAITFTLFSDNTCSTPVAGMSGTGSINSGSTSWSSAWTPSLPGTYYWQASYAGDSNNNSYTSTCGGPTEEISVVSTTATVETTIHDPAHNAITNGYLGVTVHDSATVTGVPGLPVPTGNVYFTWYTDGTCAGTGTSGANIALVAGVAHPSETQTPASAGSYSFKAFYSGDSLYDPAQSACEPLTIQPAPAAFKSLTGTNQEGSSGSNVFIGEILTYQTTLMIYPGTVNNLKLVDTLDEGLAFVGCDSITFDTPDTGGNPCGSPVISAVGSGDVNQGRQVEFDFGTIANKDTLPHMITVTYRVVVLDSPANVRGKSLRNTAVWRWADSAGAAVTLPTVQADPVTIIESTLAITKNISPNVVANGGQTTVTIVISHAASSNADAFDVVWVDPLPAGIEYVPGTITFSFAPSTVDVSNIYNLTATWNVMPLGSSITITFKIKVTLNGGNSANNITSVSWTSLPGNVSEPQTGNNPLSVERFYDPQSPVNVYGASSSATVSGKSGTVVPATGFAPDKVTTLDKQPASLVYADTGSLYLEIPGLRQYLKIVGVPQVGNSWDITWLGRQAGYLQGTAFPTWNGNSVITAHVYDSNGKPGPFVSLGSLKWGDQVIIHAYGTRYVYQVREVLKTTATDSSLLKHEDSPWVTLITCQGYNEKTGTYAYRIGVRAILIQTSPDTNSGGN